MAKRPAWYGGNKIPDSYLAKFTSNMAGDTSVSTELRSFLANLDNDNAHKTVANQ